MLRDKAAGTNTAYPRTLKRRDICDSRQDTLPMPYPVSLSAFGGIYAIDTCPYPRARRATGVRSGVDVINVLAHYPHPHFRLD